MGKVWLKGERKKKPGGLWAFDVNPGREEKYVLNTGSY
jgi:hypothetical protein